jgi:hypothetical protein
MAVDRPVLAIPQTDPRAGYLAQRTAIDAAIARVLEGGSYILGREVEAFEAAFAKFVGVANAVGVASGTDAVEIALRACGIASGDLVFTVSHTAVATVAAIERAGATPVLVDVEPGTYTMAPRELARVLQKPPSGRGGAAHPPIPRFSQTPHPPPPPPRSCPCTSTGSLQNCLPLPTSRGRTGCG